MKGVLKRRSCGGKNPGYNGFKRGNEIPSSFTCSMIQCRHIKCISHLISDQGQILQNHEDLEQGTGVLLSRSIVRTPGDRSPSIEKITQHIPASITQEQNEALLRLIMIEEVDQVHSMTLQKENLLDLMDFTTDFFHYCWPMIREEVWELIEDSRKFWSGSPCAKCNLPYPHP
jgi:hypothetical protein